MGEAVERGAHSVDSARTRMVNAVQPLSSEAVALQEASGRVLAEPLFATRDQPPFRSSAMDGYAVRCADLGQGRLKVVGEAAAGSAYLHPLEPGEAVRIFTGAPVPSGADAVVPQERVQRAGGDILVEAAARPGKNIRDVAIDFAAGSSLIDAGTPARRAHRSDCGDGHRFAQRQAGAADCIARDRD